MASLDNLKNMYDVSLKPRMLLTLLKEDIPDVKKPLGDSSSLSTVVSTVQNLKLLSESFSTSMDAKLIERWKSAVNDWFDRLLSLLTNTSMPDKCWAGICLLGVSCQECSSDRFLSSYAVWFDKLLWHIQQSPVDSELVKVASFASLSDLVTRLVGLPNTKKDGTSHASKLIQPILKLLQEDNKESVWEGAIHLLCTIINNFPASVHRHFDSTEAVVASLYFSGKCSVNVLKLAYCLALLPKSRGDADSWIAMVRKILLLVNGYLTDIFHGLEEETRWDEAVRLLVPPGEATPTSLWGQTLLEETSDRAQKRSKIASVSTLILSCCTMLTTSYPVQVTVPIRSLLALIERVLMVDGSPPRTMSPFVIATEQAFVCSELPALHSSSLELLTAVIKGMRSQLLPHVAYVVRLVKEYFRRCQLSDLRIKIYSITKILLIDRGVGIAILLAQEVVNNAILDLVAGCEDTSFSANPKPSSEALLPTSHRKRKLGASVPPEQNSDQINLGVEGPGTCSTTLISVKIASLEALEALLNVGGALRSDSWRPKVDNLLITIAADSCKGGWANEQRNSFFPNGSTSTYADLQLAAFRALLISLLSRSRMRPPHLARSLELFRRGRQETGTKLSEFCCHALLTLEVLIHPRALPLTNFQSANSYDEKDGRQETFYSGGQHQNAQFSTGMQEVRRGSHDSDDDLYESWLGASKESDTVVDGPDEILNGEKPSQNSGLQWAEKITAASALDTTGGSGNNMMVESRPIQDSMMQLQELVSSKGAAISEVDDPQYTKIKSTMSTLKTDALVSTSNERAAVEALTADIGGEIAPPVGDTGTSSSAAISKKFAAESDEDTSSDSMPDIVDADPDSD
ncbi:uncharacterized protein [Euphorbia lathyris]|uniref:uncharacterized protein isoform X3 n=1 Tax=Euphorbia lathyris TaxID=212925 RepID=UPI003313D179